MRKTCRRDVTLKPWHLSQGWRSSFRIRTWKVLLLRFCQGHESRTIAASDSMSELRKVWPEYTQIIADYGSIETALYRFRPAAGSPV